MPLLGAAAIRSPCSFGREAAMNAKLVRNEGNAAMNEKLIRGVCLAMLMAGLSAGAAAPAAKARGSEPAETNEAGRHFAFAHYMTCFALNVPFCKQEIQIAQAHGLDGFAMDFGEWLDGNGKSTRYVQNMDNMFAAARQLNTGFKLLLTPEYSVQPVDVNVEHMVRRYYEHPNAMRHKGAFCLSSYGMGGEHYDSPLTKLKAEGKKLFSSRFPASAGSRCPRAWKTDCASARNRTSTGSGISPATTRPGA